MLEILIYLPLNGKSLVNYDIYRDNLEKELSTKGWGKCRQLDLTQSGFVNYFAFEVLLENFHDGFNLIREHLSVMDPKPNIRVSLIGNESDPGPIQLFPRNELAEYLEGFEQGERYKSKIEAWLDEYISRKR
jgi:hypothetical protein